MPSCVLDILLSSTPSEIAHIIIKLVSVQMTNFLAFAPWRQEHIGYHAMDITRFVSLIRRVSKTDNVIAYFALVRLAVIHAALCKSISQIDISC